jgi:hypothetical protein
MLISWNSGTVAADTSVVEVVIRILGYNLTPFDAPQQAALQDALASVIPSITAPVSVPPKLGSLLVSTWLSRAAHRSHLLVPGSRLVDECPVTDCSAVSS